MTANAVTRITQDQAKERRAVPIAIGAALGMEDTIPDMVTLDGFDQAGEYSPRINPDYVHVEPRVKDIMRWQRLMQMGLPKGLWIAGVPQCGKSTGMEQFAARLNREVVTLTCHNRMEPADLWGCNSIGSDGAVFFAEGPALIAARRGAWLVLDEGDRLDPSTMGSLAALMEGRPISIAETGEVVYAEHGFGLVVTSNTRNGDDESGQYGGAFRQNAAVMERFIEVHWDYPEEAVEKQIVQRVVANYPDRFWTVMYKIASEVRQAAKLDDDALDTSISTGALIAWAAMTVVMSAESTYRGSGSAPLLAALDVVVCNRVSPESAATIRGLARAVVQ